jgi:methylenetetrahydrofolate dehydrogenase (NADP+)/methenyltetrahydrofolate cyclohydrolase
MQKIDGVKINTLLGEKLLNENKKNGSKPSLGILLVGEDRPSKTFTEVKRKFGEKYGFIVNILHIGEEETLEGVKNKLLGLQNQNDSVIVQLPLPPKFQVFTNEILDLLEEKKDVDSLRSNNKIFNAPIVLAFQKVIREADRLNFINKSFFGKAKNILETFFKKDSRTVAIVGLGKVVGLPIRDFCIENGFKVLEIREGNHQEIKEADIVVSGVGKPSVVKSEFIKKDSILVDFGCSYVDKIPYGDFDKNCYEVCSVYTPVPGCMGPLVVASLFENVLLAKKLAKK